MARTPAQTFEIRTPNARFKGKRAGVQFVAGVARTGDASAARECEVLGYTVKTLPRPTRKKGPR